MNIGKKAGTIIFKSLSPAAKWKMVKSNSAIIIKDLTKGIGKNKKSRIVTGAIAAGIAGVAGLTMFVNRK